MDKKQLKKVTTKIYEEYGFVKKGKYYYLDLDDVIICSGFASLYGVTYLAYNFSVKSAHREEERSLSNMFDGYDSIEQFIYFDRNAQGYHREEICFESWDEDCFANKLKELLHYYFDPYKENALNHIKRCYQEVGLVHKNERILLSVKAKEYLGI